MKDKDIIKEMIKDGLVEQTVRIQVGPMHSYNPDDFSQEICDKYGKSKDELHDLVFESKVEESFGFYHLTEEYDDMAFLFSKNSGVIDLGKRDNLLKLKEAIEKELENGKEEA